LESALRPTAGAPGSAAPARNGRSAGGPPGDQAVSTAVLLATAPAGDGTAAALLAWEQTTLLGRLLDQLSDLGIRRAHVVTRPAWAAAIAAAAEAPGVTVALLESPDLAGDLRAVDAIARSGTGSIVVANGDILTQREALAGLLKDPRVATGMLSTTVRRIPRQMAFRTRGRRGRVVSAGSPYHYIHQPNGTFLGVLKIAPPHRPALADVAGRLARLVDGRLPEGWDEELEAKARRWKLALHRRSLAGHEQEEVDDEPVELDLPADDELEDALGEVELSPADAAELARRIAAARHDVPSLLLCGLVRSDVQVGGSQLRRLFWRRPLSPEDVARAADRIGEHDEDRALLDSAVKSSDGFFTTFFVSPYSKYIARWAARRGWTPNGVTTLSVAIGFGAAAAFATGDRAGLVAGAILLQLAFTFDCVDGQLARYTRTFTKLGAWLDSIFDRTKEYAVFAGLAIGAARAGDDVWLLAGAALALQVMRHSIDFSYPAAQHQAMGAAAQPPLEQVTDVVGQAVPAPLVPEDEPQPEARSALRPRPTLKRRLRNAWRRTDRSRTGRWIKKIIGFPIGERFAAISLTAALFDARVTFIVLLAWGGFAACYTLAGRVLRSAGRRGPVALAAGAGAATGTLEAYRDDGPLALLLGRIGAPAVPAVLLILAGALAPAVALLIAGDDASWPLVAASIGWLVLLGGVSSGRPLRDRLRWAVPPALRVAEYGGVLWIAAVAGADAVPGAFALLCAITFRHYDIVYRLRHRGVTPPRPLNRAAGGWDGRLLAALALAAAGAVPAGFHVAAALLAVVFVGESIASWTSYGRTQQAPVYEDEEEDAE
jgi:phosphatidylglycerophosphate synthase